MLDVVSDITLVTLGLAMLIAFIVIGAPYVNTDNWQPLIPAQIPAPPPGADMSLWGQIGDALWNVVTAQNTAQYGIGGLIAGAIAEFDMELLRGETDHPYRVQYEQHRYTRLVHELMPDVERFGTELLRLLDDIRRKTAP